MAFSEVANVDKDCLDGLTGLMDSALVKKYKYLTYFRGKNNNMETRTILHIMSQKKDSFNTLTQI